MKPEFLEYSLERLLEDKSFISLVLHEEDKQEWEDFLDSNPAIYAKVKEAREIIQLLQDKYDLPDEDSILEIWKKIDRYKLIHDLHDRKFRIRRRLSFAASILFIISLGVFGYLYFINVPKYRFFSSDVELGNEARMVLSNGEKIALQKDNSTIEMNCTASQVTVNDSIIDIVQALDSHKQKASMNEVVIPFGKKTELLLADGTKVWLNAGSRIAFPSIFTGNTREVYLEGEACFIVAKNEKQPFIVKTGIIDVKVLGTHFNISAYPSDAMVETVLLEGSVAVEKPKTFGIGERTIILEPNQKASFKKEKNEFIVTNEPDVDLYIAWTYGWLRYERESLSSVLRKVERYYNVEIHLPANYPGDDKITGKLDLKESLNAVMVVLADATGFEYRLKGDKVFIEKRLKKLQPR
jgi:transmembrane sensor